MYEPEVCCRLNCCLLKRDFYRLLQKQKGVAKYISGCSGAVRLFLLASNLDPPKTHPVAVGLEEHVESQIRPQDSVINSVYSDTCPANPTKHTLSHQAAIVVHGKPCSIVEMLKLEQFWC